MKSVFVFTGMGAYQARDVENFLNVFEYNYGRICEHNLEQLINPRDQVLIIPGGSISDYKKVLPTIHEELISFLEGGGQVVAICAGVIAFEAIDLLTYQPSDEPIMKVVEVTSDQEKFHMILENPPILPSGEGTFLLEEHTLKPLGNRYKVGRGEAIALAGHLEGSYYNKLDPRTFSGSDLLQKLLTD